MSLIFQWILFEAVLPRKEEREIPQCNFITAQTCAQSFRQIMVPVHNVFDGLGPGSVVGEIGEKRGQKYRRTNPSDWTSQARFARRFFPFPPQCEAWSQAIFIIFWYGPRWSPKTTAKLIQNNVYCFFITIFRMAIPAFFRFTDVTVLLLFLFRFTDVS